MMTSCLSLQVKQTVGLQQLELIHVKKCAKEITGSDKPRKLPPAQAKAVNECAKKFMPPTHTKAMLEAAAKKILQAHHQKADEASVHKLMAAQAKKPANSKVWSSAGERYGRMDRQAEGGTGEGSSEVQMQAARAMLGRAAERQTFPHDSLGCSCTKRIDARLLPALCAGRGQGTVAEKGVGEEGTLHTFVYTYTGIHT